MRNLLFLAIILYFTQCNLKESHPSPIVSQEVMEQVFEEIKTPFKYGVVFQHPDTSKMIDSPTIFRQDEVWYMTYIVLMDKATKHGWLKVRTC